MQYTIREVAEMAGGQLAAGTGTGQVAHLLLDSRQVVFPQTSLFIALRGRRHDGHQFVPALRRSGIRSFLVSDPSVLPTAEDGLPPADFILVPDTQLAFHRLAGRHRQRFGLPVVAITGSNGKTIVKEWLFQLLQEDHHVVRSPKSYNSQTGVPLSVLQIAPHHTIGLFEAGISRMGEMERLADMIRPDIGILTNIGPAHNEGFPDLETKLREKLSLFRTAGTVLYCVDNPLVADAMRQQLPGRRHFTWSMTGQSADLRVTAVRQGPSSTRLTASPGSGDDQAQELTIPFSDAAAVENAIHCWALLQLLGIPPQQAAQRMNRLEPVAMRLELMQGLHGCVIINDSYNADLASLHIALDFLEQQSTAPRRTVILSDILQSGQSPMALYGTVARLLQGKQVDRFIGIGSAVSLLKDLLPERMDSRFYPDTAAFLEDFDRLTFREEVILLKGARRYAFERIAHRMAIRYHHTVLEVNLGALLHNLRVYQGLLRPGTRTMVMVKAGAYGSGSVEVARLLEFQRADCLCVAYADEGVALRKAGIRLPILVMNPEAATFDVLLANALEPEIYSLRLLRSFLAFLSAQPESRRPGRHGPYARQALHLKLETGMHRLGFEGEDLPEIIALLAPYRDTVRVDSVFSHLAASEDPAHDPFTLDQIRRFRNMYEQLATGLGYRPLRHILNTSGIVRFPDDQMEMVRLGLGLYGIDSTGRLQDRLQTVNTLKATISQIKQLASGDTIGYGRKGVALGTLRIATISIGYADGLQRKAGNGRYSVLVRGQRAPILGSICMDMTMVDITHIPDAREGDPVVIFGKDLPVEELAACLDTIPYEIFTAVSDRVKRIYVQD